MDYKLFSPCYQVVMRSYQIQPGLNPVYSVFLRNRMNIWTSTRDRVTQRKRKPDRHSQKLRDTYHSNY